MISKFLLKKGGFANHKHSNHDDESKMSPLGKEDESKCSSKEELKGRRTSSKFYVEIDGNSAGGASNLSLNSMSPAASESCLNGRVMSSPDISDGDVSGNVLAKPRLKPKPKIPSPLPLNRLPAPGATSKTTSPAKSPLSPVKIQVCARTTCFPPPWPLPPRQDLNQCQENEQDDRVKQPSEVVQPMRNIKREPTRTPGSTPQANRASRSGRRSFTTDDADIGLYKKPMFTPELAPLPDSVKPKQPVALRRGKGSEVGSRVDLFERLTCGRSRSFSKEKSSENQAEQEPLHVSSKPKPPTKPKSSNLSPDWKAVPPSKPLPVLNARSAAEAEKKNPASPAAVLVSSHPPLSSSSGEKQQAHLKAPERSKSSSDEPPGQTLGESDDFSISENYDGELEFSDDEFSSSYENDSGDENYRSDMFENQADKAAQELAPIDKAKKVAEELLKTEEAYVGRLKLLDEIFHMRILRQNRDENFIPQEVIPQMFSSIKSILLFHNDFLLPQLRSCMQEWDERVARVGQVMKKFAPFLKMYADYVRNFESAMNLIALWIQRSPGFARCLDEIQRQPECGCLTLQHHLLEPIQRVPRYELLLRDYIKNLPEESEDRIHASEALVLVTRAAEHSNVEMRKIEKFRRLLDLNDALGGALDLVNPTREFVKEGKITKISARDGDHSERYIFLFNDLLIVCQSLPLKQLGLRQQQYVVKSKLDIKGMQVLEGNNLETPHTFIIKSKQKSIEFYGGSEEFKEEWQRVLWSTISDFTKQEQKRNANANILIEFQEKGLGIRAPVWVKDQETTMCMTCGERFSTFKRRHHCRCCGKVVCNKCSAYKAKLAYNEACELRVCAHCSTALGLMHAKMSEEKSALDKTRAVLKTSAATPSVISGYLNMSRNKKNWTRKFIAIHPDFVLYSFKARQDVIAQMSLPLPGCDISRMEKCEDVQMKDFVFCISQKPLNKYYFFQADDESQRKRWIEVLLCTIVAELPKNVPSCPMPKVEIRVEEVLSSPSADSSTPLIDEPAFDAQNETERG